MTSADIRTDLEHVRDTLHHTNATNAATADMLRGLTGYLEYGDGAPVIIPAHKVRVWQENGMTYAQCGACRYGQESFGADESARSHVRWYAQMHEGAEL